MEEEVLSSATSAVHGSTMLATAWGSAGKALPV
jgi:hypothetical protein